MAMRQPKIAAAPAVALPLPPEADVTPRLRVMGHVVTAGIQRVALIAESEPGAGRAR